MKNVLVLMLIVSLTACNNASKTEEAVINDSAANQVQTGSSSKFIHTFSDTALENKITTALLKLPFVIKSDNYIDSFSNHKHGIAFILDKPDANEPDVSVQAGYNGTQRFETYYRFFVNPQTMEIKVYDAVADKKLTLKEFVKTQQ